MRKEYDFSQAKPVSKIPVLTRLQAEHGGKARITMRIDTDILSAFKARAQAEGSNYQSMMNAALRQYTQGWTLTGVIEKAVKDSLKKALHN